MELKVAQRFDLEWGASIVMQFHLVGAIQIHVISTMGVGFLRLAVE